MSDDVNRSRRRYDASGRRARAQQTREEIVDAARRLFEANGYAGTAVTDVARAANVSAETIYKAFGSKGSLLSAVITASIRGDAEATPLRRRPVIEEIRAEHDPRRQLERYARLLAEVNPRVAPLVRVMREAAVGDPEIAAALEQLKANRLEGMSEFAAQLADARCAAPRRLTAGGCGRPVDPQFSGAVRAAGARARLERPAVRTLGR